MEGYPDYSVVIYDKLTYAGNPENLAGLAEAFAGRYTFVQGDICDAELVEKVMAERGVDTVVNFAAETHVDRSLLEAGAFVMTDVYGTFVLLEAARKLGVERFLHMGTDEVYGEVAEGSSKETDHLEPRSPYSASKAGADLMVRAYHVSHGVYAVTTRASNNFGPRQYPEKFIPLFVTNAIDDLPLPLYGDGRQVRDWLYVQDCCEGILTALRKGKPGEVYNIGGGNERHNIEVAHSIVSLLGKPSSLIQHITDRPAHDRRYSLDSSKLMALGWSPKRTFEEALEETVRWYVDNEPWWRRIKSGEYAEYYQRQYGARLQASS
ncbi:MAG: dTDP-glucose 4,6-dehydratase [Dehalococcoidia bacterium]|nr:dTDP-glucose 4,6-dehydratase [Dehalococcoidia bacterium]